MGRLFFLSFLERVKAYNPSNRQRHYGTNHEKGESDNIKDIGMLRGVRRHIDNHQRREKETNATQLHQHHPPEVWPHAVPEELAVGIKEAQRQQDVEIGGKKVGQVVNDEHLNTHEHMDEEALRQRGLGVAWRIAEENPSGHKEKASENEPEPPRAHLFHRRQWVDEVLAVDTIHVVPSEDAVDQNTDQCHEHEHLHRRERHLSAAVDVVADEVAWPPDELPQGVEQRAVVHAPHLGYALPYTLPRDFLQASLLRAIRAIVAYKIVVAIHTMMGLFLVKIPIESMTLPLLEALVLQLDVHCQ